MECLLLCCVLIFAIQFKAKNCPNLRRKHLHEFYLKLFCDVSINTRERPKICVRLAKSAELFIFANSPVIYTAKVKTNLIQFNVISLLFLSLCVKD